MSLGKYLEQKCFNESIIEDVLKFTRCYTHDQGKISVTVERYEKEVSFPNESLIHNDRIIMWSFCKICQKFITPFIPLSKHSYNYSFGKFLETTFYNHDLMCRIGNCNHSIHRDHIRYFGKNNLVAKLEYCPLKVYNICIPGTTLEYSEQVERIGKQILMENVVDAATKAYNDFFMLLSGILYSNLEIIF